jgi:hypothetical protein
MKAITGKTKKTLFILAGIFLGLGLAVCLAAPSFPGTIERGYSTRIYRGLVGPLSQLTGIFPFSLAEVLLAATFLFALYRGGRWLLSFCKKPRVTLRSLPRGLARLALILALLYVSFYLLWGLNYNRLSFADISGLPLEPAGPEELRELAQSLVLRANVLREEVEEDGAGVMTLDTDIRGAFARAELGYRQAALIYPALGGRYGPPKSVFLSPYWSYTGISGMYFPFTGEANINTDMPPLLLPATALHEMAHQRGFAREDEANFLAYLACSLHPHRDFQYSGTVLALVNTMNALYRADLNAYKEVRAQYSDGLNRDLKNWSEYWQRFAGPVEKASERVNDAYLKANRQEDGVRSYGRMIDLLLALFRQGSIKN